MSGQWALDVEIVEYKYKLRRCRHTFVGSEDQCFEMYQAHALFFRKFTSYFFSVSVSLY